jgi:uncharacterized membrane protein
MKSLTLAGLILIVLGIGMLVYQGFSYTKREKVLDIGPIEASRETRKTVPIPPVAGAAALVGGIVLVISNVRKN